MQKAVNLQKVANLLLEPQGHFRNLSQYLFTLLEQPAAVEHNKWWNTGAPAKACSEAKPLESPEERRPCRKPGGKNLSQEHLPVFTNVAVRYHLLSLLKYRECFCSLKRCWLQVSFVVRSLVKELLVLFRPYLYGLRKPLQLSEVLKHIVIDQFCVN